MFDVARWTFASSMKSIIRDFICALLSIGLLGSAQPIAAVQHDSSPMRRILVLGDSLSEGFQLKHSEAYPALLAEKLRGAGLDFEVTNASASGGTTEGGLRRLPPHLKNKIDIFILELGVNDAFLGVPVEQIRNNLQQTIEQVKQRNPNVRIVIAGMQLPNHSADDYVHAFGQVYVDLAAKNHAALVPYLLEGVGGNPALNLPDGIHPNAAGQKILAENVWHVLEPIAREVARGPNVGGALVPRPSGR
jgi:acyl-CoA thioesterase-1